LPSLPVDLLFWLPVRAQRASNFLVWCVSERKGSQERSGGGLAPCIRGQAGRRPRAPPSVHCVPLQCDRFPNKKRSSPTPHLKGTCKRTNIKTTREMLTYVYGWAGSRVRGASEEATWCRTVRSVSLMQLLSRCQLPAPSHPHVPRALVDCRLCSSCVGLREKGGAAAAPSAPGTTSAKSKSTSHVDPSLCASQTNASRGGAGTGLRAVEPLHKRCGCAPRAR
jgi:hypothetical protein